MKISSLLTILDKPKNTPRALERAVELAELADARIDCLAFTWHPIAEKGDIFSADERAKVRKGLLSARKLEAQNTIDSVLSTSGVGSNSLQTRLKTIWCKDLASRVAVELEKAPRDLLIKTVHQSKTLLHTPLDWELLRNSAAPVLLTTDSKQRRSGRILATLDLRRNDAKHRRLNKRVLEAASSFAALQGAEIHVVAVTPMSQVLHDLEIIDERALAKRTKKATEPYLQSLIKPLGLSKAQVHQPVGKVGNTVGRIAKQLKADLMVVGTSTHRVRQALGVGNSAEQILLNAGCEVLAVHG